MIVVNYVGVSCYFVAAAVVAGTPGVPCRSSRTVVTNDSCQTTSVVSVRCFE